MPHRLIGKAVALLLITLSFTSTIYAQTLPSKFRLKESGLELERAVRAGAFYDVVGRRSAVFGYENRQSEAWVYPLKILDEFDLSFQLEGFPASFKASDLAININVRPEATTFTYAHPAFTVKQIIFAPIDEPGIIMLFEVNSKQPLTITASFKPKLKLAWLAGLASGYLSYDEQNHLYYLTEDSGRYAAIVGSPSGKDVSIGGFDEPPREAAKQFAMRVAPELSKSNPVPLVITGSVEGQTKAKATYDKIITSTQSLYEKNVDYYAKLQAETVSITTPDERLNKAFAWAKVGMDKGIVTNPFLGTGLVAGYSPSGDSERPGFAWFFGRDALWTSFALNSIGSFETTRHALSMLTKYQRADGKIPHEISQTASLVSWFTDYPYPWASADANPLYVIANADYWRASGDANFIQANWKSIVKAYRFSEMTDTDANALIENTAFGHGWVEQGKLFPAHEEIYLQGVWIEASRCIAEMAEAMNDADLSKRGRDNAERTRAAMERIYWLPQQQRYAFATKLARAETSPVAATPASKEAISGKTISVSLVEEDTVFPAVPLWWRTMDEARAQRQIDRLGSSHLMSDWGARGLSGASPDYNPYAYHHGAVWLLFTGWTSIGAYAYGRPHIGFQALMSNALLLDANALGYLTEVISGDFNVAFPGSSHHQIWSEAMVVTPAVRGLFGIEASAGGKELRIAPQLPAHWNDARVRNIPFGHRRYDFNFQRTENQTKLILTSRVTNQSEDVSVAPLLVLAPSFPLDAKLRSVTVNNRKTDFELKRVGDVQQAEVKINAPPSTIEAIFTYDEGTDVSIEVDSLRRGDESVGLRIISARVDDNELRLILEGRSGFSYHIKLRTPHLVNDSASLKIDANKNLMVTFDNSVQGYQRRELIIPLKRKS